MRDILPQLDEWPREGEEIAIATVVSARGSTPRPVGARMLMTRSGRLVGSVSGGCVETDTLERGLRVLDEGRPALVRYGPDPHGLGVGLACGGEIEVLIQPLVSGPVHELLHSARARRLPAALCVALDPEELRGRVLAVDAAGAVAGSIDPRGDAPWIAAAEEALAAGGARTLRSVAGDDGPRAFVEGFPPPPRLYLVGANHIAVPLCRLAAELGFDVAVIDPRPALATAERFGAAARLIHAWPDEAFEKIELDADAHVVTLSHDPKFDLPALAAGLAGGAGSVGALGSRATHRRRLRELRERGVAESDLARIRGPVGLDLGARTPAEIALSILAEIVADRRGRSGGPLHARTTRIHADD